jgi:hypothetical protein
MPPTEQTRLDRDTERPWVPNPRLPHPFQSTTPIYYKSIHHQIFTTACGLCGRGRGARVHLLAEENDSPRWPLA